MSTRGQHRSMKRNRSTIMNKMTQSAFLQKGQGLAIQTAAADFGPWKSAFVNE